MAKIYSTKTILSLLLVAFLLWLALLFSQPVLAQPSGDCQPYTSKQLNLIKEHAHWGLPSKEPVLIRNAYIARYNEEHRVPEWVSYHITDNYLNTPYREQQFKKFHADPDINSPVKNSEKNGLR